MTRGHKARPFIAVTLLFTAMACRSSRAAADTEEARRLVPRLAYAFIMLDVEAPGTCPTLAQLYAQTEERSPQTFRAVRRVSMHCDRKAVVMWVRNERGRDVVAWTLKRGSN